MYQHNYWIFFQYFQTIFLTIKIKKDVFNLIYWKIYNIDENSYKSRHDLYD